MIESSIQIKSMQLVSQVVALSIACTIMALGQTDWNCYIYITYY